MSLLIEKDPVLTTDDVINILRTSRRTVMKYIHGGRLRATKVGKRYWILQSELYNFLNGKTEFGESFNP